VSETAPPMREVIEGERVTLRRLPEARFEEVAERIVADPQARPWWGGHAESVVRWFCEGEDVAYLIELDGHEAGVIVASEETDPDYRHAGIDITLYSEFIGKGVGGAALKTMCRYLFDERSHHRITIDPAAENTRAITAYERVGFRPVGIMRQYERGDDGTWHDGLLMDMLRGELAE